jgi:hypothetical protein
MCVWHMCEKGQSCVGLRLVLNNDDLSKPSMDASHWTYHEGGETGWMQSYSAALHFDLSVSLSVDSLVSRLDRQEKSPIPANC